jgi:hypothetical protein
MNWKKYSVFGKWNLKEIEGKFGYFTQFPLKIGLGELPCTKNQGLTFENRN